MFDLREYRNKTDRLSDLLPWAALIAPGVVLNKDGSFQRTFRFRGPDLESSTEAQLVASTARLNNILKRLGSGWVIYVESRRQTYSSYPEKGHFPEAVSWLLDAERQQTFAHMEGSFESRYFLTLQYLPPLEAASKLGKAFIEGGEVTEEHDYHKHLEFFQTTTTKFLDILSDFMFSAEALDDDATLSYLHNTVSTKVQKVKTPEIPMYLDSVLADSPLLGGLEPKLGDKAMAVVSVLGFPATTLPAILDQLNNLPIAYRWVTRFIPLDKVEAEQQLKQYKRRWFAKRKGVMHLLQEMFTKSESQLIDTAAIDKSRDADEALYELANDFVAYGYFTATVTVLGDTRAEAEESIREVERVINGLGFTTINETFNAVEAWLSSLPGQAYANVRAPLIHTLNLAHLIPFSAVWAGAEEDEHLQAPPLFYSHTSGRTPFRFVNHIGDVGHQMILGPTGAGKSVLLNFMALQFLRYQDAQVFVFDKGKSFLTSTYAVGGGFYELGNVESGGLSFQPLAQIDQQQERTWAAEWVQGLLLNENVEITPQVKEVVWQALESLSHLPVEQRTLTALCALLQDMTLRQALLNYTLDGPYGYLLDADKEEACESFWQCFEMEELMAVPSVVAPVLSYLFHRLERQFTGKPTLLILDEAWLFLDHPMFALKIKEWLKTLRKFNVSVVFATQSVEDALSSGIAPALIESCPSRVFLPNDRVLEPQVRASYEQLGLNERQLGILASAFPKRQYYYQSRIGNRLFDLDLGPVALAFCAASKSEDKKRVYQLLEQHGRSGFLEAYMKANNLDWAWDAIQDLKLDGE
jgi:type IV secretion system protein VirB4